MSRTPDVGLPPRSCGLLPGQQSSSATTRVVVSQPWAAPRRPRARALSSAAAASDADADRRGAREALAFPHLHAEASVRRNYDRDPGRCRLARSVLRRHALADDIHERVVHRLVREGLTPVLDVGRRGELARHLPRGGWVGLDGSAEMLARAPKPAVRADACTLPFPEASL
jgi:hypothetical protein